MIKSLSKAQKYLEQFIPTPEKAHSTMQLERIEQLCKLLGNPQTKYPIIHVGGTSGKGSTATFAATILKAAGLKVGLHISPHLEFLTERMQINNLPIPNIKFIKLINEFSLIIQRIKGDLHEFPSYFEILVAMSFVYFAREKVDAAVIEVGLGGKLDATNIIPPSVAVLTNVSLDHTNILGKSVYSILKDKMGIIKRDAPAVISGVTQPKLQNLLIKKCKLEKVPLLLLGRDFQNSLSPLKLLGEFQHQNFSLAYKACEVFIKRYFPNKISDFSQALVTARKTTFIPGRLEIIQKDPLMILDGAHNKAKMAALVVSLKKLYPNKQFITIIAVKQGKPAKTLLTLLKPITAYFICTSFSQSTDTGFFTSNQASYLATLTHKPTYVFSNSKEAITRACIMAKKHNKPLLITGSLYLVGEIRSYLNTK